MGPGCKKTGEYDFLTADDCQLSTEEAEEQVRLLLKKLKATQEDGDSKDSNEPGRIKKHLNCLKPLVENAELLNQMTEAMNSIADVPKASRVSEAATD